MKFYIKKIILLTLLFFSKMIICCEGPSNFGPRDFDFDSLYPDHVSNYKKIIFFYLSTIDVPKYTDLIKVIDKKQSIEEALRNVDQDYQKYEKETIEILLNGALLDFSLYDCLCEQCNLARKQCEQKMLLIFNEQLSYIIKERKILLIIQQNLYPRLIHLLLSKQLTFCDVNYSDIPIEDKDVFTNAICFLRKNYGIGFYGKQPSCVIL